MTPKEKAIWLVDDFNRFDLSFYEKKQCALICVDEMYKINNNPTLNDYLIEVKQEIENL